MARVYVEVREGDVPAPGGAGRWIVESAEGKCSLRDQSSLDETRGGGICGVCEGARSDEELVE
jgi:hypothetical protein